jgi:hypothetical protein
MNMSARTYSLPFLLLLWSLCFGFLQSCEKEAVTPQYPQNLRSGNTGVHSANAMAWQPCIPATAYQLLDPSFNPKPVGYLETGQVLVSAAMDSLQIEVPVNAYWSVTAIQWKIATSEALLPNVSWSTQTFSPAASSPRLRIANPMGTSVALQLNIQCQKQNLMGNVMYTCTMSPVTHVRTDGSRYIQYSLPQACCPESYGQTDPATY